MVPASGPSAFQDHWRKGSSRLLSIVLCSTLDRVAMWLHSNICDDDNCLLKRARRGCLPTLTFQPSHPQHQQTQSPFQLGLIGRVTHAQTVQPHKTRFVTVQPSCSQSASSWKFPKLMFETKRCCQKRAQRSRFR
jgi:hypothetical protein